MHLIGTERYYTYHATCISREEDADRHFDDRDTYVRNNNAAARTMEDLFAEFSAVRDATISLYESMTPAMLDIIGYPENIIYSARSLGWMCVGHNIHHCNLIREKYLTEG